MKQYIFVPICCFNKCVEYISLVTEMSSAREENPCMTSYREMLSFWICCLEQHKDQDHYSHLKKYRISDNMILVLLRALPEFGSWWLRWG